jgi:hypothetical protein
MRTIIDNAESVLQTAMERANEKLKMQFNGRKGDQCDQFSLQRYAMYEARCNPDFFKWLFDDPEITFFGTSLSESQREEYYTWLKDL